MKRLFVIAICLAAFSGRAERFLTVEEALRVCFPKTTNFQAITLPLSPEEKKKLKKQDLKMWVAKPDGVLMVDQVIGKHEFIDYAVAISTNGSVLQVEILEYREHYGGEVRQPKWREQFRGKTARDTLKLGGDVYNITGATLSCRHVTEGVKKLLAIFELVRPRLLAGDGLRAQK